MKKNKLINGLCFALSMCLFITSCDDDKGESTSAGFAGISSNYFEADGTGDIFIPYRDGSISQSDITVSGTATLNEDYTLSFGSDGITVTVIDDEDAEYTETVRFLISGTSGASNKIHTLNIASDDPGYLNVQLQWSGAADLDLYSWYYNEEDEDWENIDFSDPGNTLDPIDWRDPDGLYGFTYNYWGGTASPLPFTVLFTPVGVTAEGGTDPLTFEAVYTLDNVDPVNLQIEQTMVKNGTEFTDFSDIEVPEEGSRKAEILNKLRKKAAELSAKKGK